MDLPRPTPADAEFQCDVLVFGGAVPWFVRAPFWFKKPLAEFFVEVPAQ